MIRKMDEKDEKYLLIGYFLCDEICDETSDDIDKMISNELDTLDDNTEVLTLTFNNSFLTPMHKMHEMHKMHKMHKYKKQIHL